MEAFHAFWSAPNRERNAGGVALPDYETLTLMLSALKWREKNGPIRLVTDSAGAAYFARAGLDALWNAGIDASLDALDGAIDPKRFWAAGKLEALRRAKAPCVLLDTDLILWENIGARLRGCVVAAHCESLSPDVYPAPETVFALDPGYSFPREWDFSLPAANTAFLYLPSDELRRYYTAEAFRFMRALRGGSANSVVTMCFAEQRILPMCAAALGIGVQTLTDEHAQDEQSFVTHLWGAKREFARSPERRVEYCLGCVLRIVRDFPEWTGALEANEETRRYLDSL